MKVPLLFRPQLPFYFVLLCPSGSWSISGGGPGDPSWVFQRHCGWKGCRPILEEGHLQGDLQAGQRGSRGFQIPQLSARTPPRLTRTGEETQQTRQTSQDFETTVRPPNVRFEEFEVFSAERLKLFCSHASREVCWWWIHLLQTKLPSKDFIETEVFQWLQRGLRLTSHFDTLRQDL